MTEDDLALLRPIAEQKLRPLAPTTQKRYARYLKNWERFTKKKTLATYDVNEVIRWNSRAGNARDRHAAFPVRCLEMLQVLYPDKISVDFFVPQGLWTGKKLTYRESVIARDIMKRVIHACIQDIEETKTFTRDTAVPFLVLLAVRSGMNVEPLLTLRRSCCSALDNGCMLRWFKGRSGQILSADFAPMEWGPMEIVQRVQELNAGAEYLWVVPDSRQIPYRFEDDRVHDWFQRHEIRPFPLREIRPAMATILYEDTGDIAAVKEYLHHESIATTILYLAEYAVLPRAERDISAALDSIARKAGLL